MAGVSGIGHGGSLHRAEVTKSEHRGRAHRLSEHRVGHHKASEHGESEHGARADAPGQRVRETVHEAKARFRTEGGAWNQGQAIHEALEELRHPEPEETHDDADETTAVVDAGSDPTGGVTDSPLSTQGTLDLLA